MILGLAVPSAVCDQHVDFSKRALGPRRVQVRSHETVETVLRCAQVTGLVIPYSIVGADYDPFYFIEHVRCDANPDLARVPIRVLMSEDEYLEWDSKAGGFEENFYKSIAVVFSVDPKETEFSPDIDDDAWKAYQRQAAVKPRFIGGRHDKANLWGVVIGLRALAQLSRHTGLREKIGVRECNLSEDTYFKRLLNSLESCPDPNAKIEKLKIDLLREHDETARLLDSIGRGFRVLCVEDQLEDGWGDFYTEFFHDLCSNVEIVFAEDARAAERQFDRSLDLVMLDIRLAEERNNQEHDETTEVGGLSGIRLAKKFRKKAPTVPVIAATASNKAWMLEELLEEGIDAYWVKDSPDICKSLSQGMRNLMSLYRKIREVVAWSRKTRGWIDSLYGCARVVSESERTVGESLEHKARSLHGLLKRSLGPFSDDLASGLQWNLAFLVVFSGMNDLVSWCCRVDEKVGEGTRSWIANVKGEQMELVTQSETEGGKYFLQDGRSRAGSAEFPDIDAALMLLNAYRLIPQAQSFRDARRIRNKLPLTHGKVGRGLEGQEKHVDAEPESIDRLVCVLVDLVEIHSGKKVSLY